MSVIQIVYILNKAIYFVSIFRLARVKGLAHICNDLFLNFEDTNEHFVNASVFNVIEEMAPPLNDTIKSCNWGAMTGPTYWTYGYNDCSKMFAPILTEEGFCFAFNVLNSANIYSEK